LRTCFAPPRPLFFFPRTFGPVTLTCFPLDLLGCSLMGVLTYERSPFFPFFSRAFPVSLLWHFTVFFPSWLVPAASPTDFFPFMAFLRGIWQDYSCGDVPQLPGPPTEASLFFFRDRGFFYWQRCSFFVSPPLAPPTP